MTDTYEAHLLGMAEDWRATHAPAQLTLLTGWAQMLTAEDCWEARGDTTAEMLAALLRDLGVEVPERPSAAHLTEIWDGLDVVMATHDSAEYVVEFLRSQHGPSVLALLEGKP